MTYIKKVIYTVFLLACPTLAVAAPVEKAIQINIDDSNIPNISSYQMKLSYLEANPEKKETILFIHGNSASKEFFERLMSRPELAQYRLVAVDLPGHGKSDDFPKTIEDSFKANEDQIFTSYQHYYTWPGYAHILHAFMDKMNLLPQDTRLFGWSLGGHVAIEMVADRPQMKRVVITGTPVNNFQATASGFARLKTYPLGLGNPFPNGTSVFDLLAYREPFNPAQAVKFHELGGIDRTEMSEAAGVRTNPEARYFMFKFGLETHRTLQDSQSQDSIVRRNKEKFIILQGDKDPIRIQGDDLRRINSYGVSVVEIHGAGHATFFESPHETAQFIIQMAEPRPPRIRGAILTEFSDSRIKEFVNATPNGSKLVFKSDGQTWYVYHVTEKKLLYVFDQFDRMNNVGHIGVAKQDGEIYLSIFPEPNQRMRSASPAEYWNDGSGPGLRANASILHSSIELLGHPCNRQGPVNYLTFHLTANSEKLRDARFVWLSEDGNVALFKKTPDAYLISKLVHVL